jgi:hypothetical protein
VVQDRVLALQLLLDLVDQLQRGIVDHHRLPVRRTVQLVVDHVNGPERHPADQ